MSASFKEMIAGVGTLAVLQAEDVHHHDAPEPDMTVDKVLLAAEIDALLNSVGVAIARVQHRLASHPSLAMSAALSRRMEQYQAVQTDAGRVLSALNALDASHPHSYQLDVLRSQEHAIYALLTLEEENADKEDSDDAEESSDTRAMTDELDARIADDPMMQVLAQRCDTLSRLKAHYAAFRENAVRTADNSRNDLAAAIAVATLLYEHRGDPEEFLKEIRDKMHESATVSASQEAHIEARIELICEEAHHIHDGMIASQAAAAQCLLDAARHCMDWHISMQYQECCDCFDEARVCCASCSPKRLTAFDRCRKDWIIHMEHAAREFRAELQAERDMLDVSARNPAFSGDLHHLAQQTGIGRMMEHWKQHATEGMELLKEHETALHEIRKETLDARDRLILLLKGDSNKGIEEVAEALGEDKQEMIVAIADFRDRNHIHSEHNWICGQIAAINNALHPHGGENHHLHHGHD